MTSKEFRSNQTLVGGMRGILNEEFFQIALQTLVEEGPLSQPDENLSADRKLGRIEGADDVLRRMKRLASYNRELNVDNPKVV
jgi:hypothetical protein